MDDIQDLSNAITEALDKSFWEGFFLGFLIGNVTVATGIILVLKRGPL
jgi:hypothetical protein